MILNELQITEPMSFIDQVQSQTEDTIVCSKLINHNAPFFQGHFPNNPVMPGVYQLEAIRQATLLLLADQREKYFLSQVTRARFKEMILPDSQLTITCQVITKEAEAIQVSGQVLVDQRTCCSVKLTFAKK